MSEEYSPEEIKALIHRAFALQIQRPKSANVATNTDGSNPAVQEWHIPVKVEGQEEAYEAAYNPLLDATALAYDTPVDIILNYEGGFEVIGLNAIQGRAAYSGTVPTPNFAWKQHTHEDDTGGGQLNASLIFDEGVVDEVYGGTGQAVYAVGDLLYASGTTTLARLADVATGNALISGGVSTAPVWGKIGLTTHVSGTLGATNGGTGQSTYATGDLIYASAANTLSKLAAGTNGHVLTLAAGVPTWAAAGGGGWTDDGTVVRLTTSTDNVTIGSASDIAKLGIVGDTDEIQLLVRGAVGQVSNPFFSVETSSSEVLFVINTTGQVNVNPSELAGGDFIVSAPGGETPFFVDASANTVFIDGSLVFNQLNSNLDARFAGDNDANLLFLDASTDRVGIGDSTPDGRFAVVGRADEIQTIIRGNATQTSSIFEIQDSTSNVQVSVSGLGAAVFNEEGNDADFRIESDTQVNAFFLDGTNGAVQQLGNAPAAYLHMAASTTALASSRMPVGTAPTSPGAGDEWHDSSRNAMYSQQGGMTHGQLNRIYGQYSTVGGSNTTSPIALIGGSTIGSATIAADEWFAGRSFWLKASGYISTGGIARDITITVALGGTTIASQTLTGLSIVTAGRVWWVNLDITCQTTGASGTIFTQAFGSLFNTLLDRLENTATTTHNMTGNLALTFTFTFATANSNTQIQCTNLNLYAIH